MNLFSLSQKSKNTAGPSARLAGFTTLISVIVTGAIAVTLAVSLLFSAVTSARSTLSIERSSVAKALANACAEEGLRRIWWSVFYSGGETITFSQGTCTFSVTRLSGQERIVTASGETQGVFRKVRVALDRITTKINITSWREVSDF